MTAVNPSEQEWTRDVVAGVPLRTLPPGPDAAGVVVVLADVEWPAEADLGALAELLRQSRLGAVLPDIRPWWIDRPDSAFATPQSPLAFVADQLVPWISAQWPGDRRLAALGVGFGGQGALQLAYRFPHLFPIAAGISPAIDFHRLYDSTPHLQDWFENQERARQETATLRLHPLNWPPHQWFACPRGDWRFDGCERLASKLLSIGIPFTSDLETPAGPEYGRTQLSAAIRFIADRLREPVTSREIRIGR